MSEGKGRRCAGEKGSSFIFLLLVLLFSFSDSKVAGTGVAIVVELLLDVDHVATGVLHIPELGPATEVSEVAELRQP